MSNCGRLFSLSYFLYDSKITALSSSVIGPQRSTSFNRAHEREIPAKLSLLFLANSSSWCFLNFVFFFFFFVYRRHDLTVVVVLLIGKLAAYHLRREPRNIQPRHGWMTTQLIAEIRFSSAPLIFTVSFYVNVER